MKFPVFSRRSGNWARRDAFAAASQHSHLVGEFLALSYCSAKSPKEARKSATELACFCGTRLEDALLVRERAIFRPLSLQAIFGGHTCRGADDPTIRLMRCWFRLRCGLKLELLSNKSTCGSRKCVDRHALGSMRSLMMRRWISLVPSKIVVSLASRQ